MHFIRVRKRVDSETLYLPEIKELIGKDVEIVVTEQARDAPPNPSSSPYDGFFALAGQDVVDPEAYKELRAASMI